MTTYWCVLLLFLSPHCSLFGVRLSENVLQKIPCSEQQTFPWRPPLLRNMILTAQFR